MARLSAEERQERLDAGQPHAIRLDVAAAMMRCGPLEWRDEDQGIIAARADLLGDVVLARKDALMAAMPGVASEDGADEVLLFVVDILNEEATLLVPNDLVKRIAEASFGCTVEGDTVVLPGVMSRKKQIIPPLMATLQNILDEDE